MQKLWVEIRSSLWFVPSLLVLAGIVAAIVLIEVDSRLAGTFEVERWRPFINASPDGAREMLGAIASSAITVAGVAFSITVVTLSLASTQYTPRILRNFMRDPGNQWVLGIFMGVFAYCLIVLRTVYGENDAREAFVPLISVTFAMGLALLSIGCLIYFVHHTATSIQASNILEVISAETIEVVRELCPLEGEGETSGDPALAERADPEGWHPVAGRENGYLQKVDVGGLSGFVREQKVKLRVERNVGDFVMRDLPLLWANRPLDKEERAQLLSFFAVGNFRTVEQDPAFGIRQIVDIAMKALSPGVNDTSTAIICLDYLGTILAEMGRRHAISPLHCAPGEVFAPSIGFHEVAAQAFDEVRLSACGNVTVLIHMLCVIERLLVVLGRPRTPELLMHATLVAETADRTVPVPYDRQRLNDVLAKVRAVATGPYIPDIPPQQCPAPAPSRE